MRFDRKDWALVGLLLVSRVLVNLESYFVPYFWSDLARDPFGLVMVMGGGSLLWACIIVYVVKRVFNWYRALPDAE